MLFASKQFTGYEMNAYGIIFRPGSHRVENHAIRQAMIAEARAAGWTQQRSDNPDEGMVWTPPVAEDAGKGIE